MSWSVEFLEKNTGKYLHSPNICMPVSLTWDDHFGPDRAELSCPCDDLDLRDWGTLLGQDVRVYDPAGSLAWWGYLNSVEQMTQFQRFSIRLDEMANRLAVCYRLAGDSEFSPTQQTTWKEDPLSQDDYGVKQALISRPFLEPDVADQLAQCWLAEFAFPMVRLQTGASTKPSKNRVVLHLKGWLHTLSWRVWQGWNGIVEHRPAQRGVQTIGADASCLRLAQSFLVSTPVEADSVSVKARRQGSPTDELRFSLQQDLNGKPSGLNLTSQTVQAAKLSEESYTWLRLVLPDRLGLSDTDRYWLVIERSGVSDLTNHYLVGLDEEAGFPHGGLLLHNGADWIRRVPNADLLFRFAGKKDLCNQIEDLVAEGGQFINGVDTSLLPDLPLPLSTNPDRTCLEGLFALMEQGSIALLPLVSSVSPSRRLMIREQTAPSEAVFYLETNGTISNRFGQRLTSPWQVVGQWLRNSTANPIYVSSMEYRCGTDEILLNRPLNLRKVPVEA